MGADHKKFQILTNFSICKQVLRCFKLKLVNKYSPQVAFLFLPNAWIIGNASYFPI